LSTTIFFAIVFYRYTLSSDAKMICLISPVSFADLRGKKLANHIRTVLWSSCPPSRAREPLCSTCSVLFFWASPERILVWALGSQV